MDHSKEVLKKIIKRVLIAHFVLLLIFSFTFKRRPKKSIYVAKNLKENFRTIQKPKPKKVIAKAPPVKKVAKKVEVPKKKTAPAKKKAEPKPKVHVATKLNVEPLKIEPMQEIEPQKYDLKVPQAISDLKVEELQKDDDACPYQDYICSIISKELHLAPNTFVKLEISLNREGHVTHVKYLDASDAFSKDRIIYNIKQMQFADFFGEIAKESEYTFLITTEGS